MGRGLGYGDRDLGFSADETFIGEITFIKMLSQRENLSKF